MNPSTYFKNRLLKELEDPQRGDNCNFEGLNDSEESMPDLIDRASSIVEPSLSLP